MLCGWISSSVARFVVNSVPPTFSSTRSGKHLVTGEGAAWRLLVEGCCWGRDPAAATATAAVPTRGTLRGGLFLLPVPGSCPYAAAGGSPPPACVTAGRWEGGEGMEGWGGWGGEVDGEGGGDGGGGGGVIVRGG